MGGMDYLVVIARVDEKCWSAAVYVRESTALRRTDLFVGSWGLVRRAIATATPDLPGVKTFGGLYLVR
jgi:hypothetical protein